MESSGLQIAMTVTAPGSCPAGEVSSVQSDPVESVTWNTADDEGTITEEFTVDASVDRPDLTPVFETNTHTRYRFTRQRDGHCVCESIERRDCPLKEVRAENGQLNLTFYAPDVETVRSIVADLREQFGDVQLQHLCRSGDLESENLVLVDRNRLTDRQLEVLETAYEAGYFEHPKETNASEIAEALDISLSTFTEHLSIAQAKVLDALLDSD